MRALHMQGCAPACPPTQLLAELYITALYFLKAWSLYGGVRTDSAQAARAPALQQPQLAARMLLSALSPRLPWSLSGQPGTAAHGWFGCGRAELLGRGDRGRGTPSSRPSFVSEVTWPWAAPSPLS